MAYIPQYFDAKLTVRSKVKLFSQIKSKLSSNPDRMRLFRATVFGPWLDIPDLGKGNHIVNFVLQHQVIIDKLLDSCPPILYKIGNNVLKFGREQFLLMTGFRFGRLPPHVQIDRSPFALRVFPEKQLIRKVTVKGNELLDLFGNDTEFSKLSAEDAVRVCLLLVAEIVFIGRGPWYIVDSHLLQLVEDFGAWNAYPWGEFLWTRFYKNLANLVPRHYNAHCKEKLQENPSTIATYNISGFFLAFKIWILESYPTSTEWWKKDPSKIPRCLCWSKGNTFAKRHYGKLFGPRSIPVLDLLPTNAEMLEPWFAPSKAYLSQLDSLQDQLHADHPTNEVHKEVVIFDTDVALGVAIVNNDVPVTDKGQSSNQLDIHAEVDGINNRLAVVEEALNIQPRSNKDTTPSKLDINVGVLNDIKTRLAVVEEALKIQRPKTSTDTDGKSEEACFGQNAMEIQTSSPIQNENWNGSPSLFDLHSGDVHSADYNKNCGKSSCVNAENERVGLTYIDPAAFPSTMSQLVEYCLHDGPLPLDDHIPDHDPSHLNLPNLNETFSQSAVEGKQLQLDEQVELEDYFSVYGFSEVEDKQVGIDEQNAAEKNEDGETPIEVDDKSCADKPGDSVQAHEIHAHVGVFNLDDKPVKGVHGNENTIVDCNSADQHSHDREKVREVVLNVDDKSIEGVKVNENVIVDCNAVDEHSHDREAVLNGGEKSIEVVQGNQNNLIDSHEGHKVSEAVSQMAGIGYEHMNHLGDTVIHNEAYNVDAHVKEKESGVDLPVANQLSTKAVIDKIDNDAVKARQTMIHNSDGQASKPLPTASEYVFMRGKRKRNASKFRQSPYNAVALKKTRKAKVTKESDAKVTQESTPVLKRDDESKRTKQVGKCLQEPYVNLPPTTPQLPKRRSKRLRKDINPPPGEDNHLETWVEDLSRPEGCDINKITKPACMATFIKKDLKSSHSFPWGLGDVIVHRKFWLALLGYGRGNKKGWLGDEHLDLWVDLMWQFRPGNADWAMAGPFFSSSILEGSMRAYYATCKRYPLPWSSVEKVYFPVNVPECHWFLAELEIRTGVITIYDTLGTPEPETREKNLKWRVTFERKLPQYLNLCKVLQANSISVSDYKITFRVADDVPIQANAYGDCGVWVCIFLHRLGNNLSMKVDDPLQVALAYREHMVEYFWKYKVVVHTSDE